MAIRTTSKGMRTIISPFRLNMIKMVNNNAISVMGEMKGMNFD